MCTVIAFWGSRIKDGWLLLVPLLAYFAKLLPLIRYGLMDIAGQRKIAAPDSWYIFVENRGRYTRRYPEEKCNGNIKSAQHH